MDDTIAAKPLHVLAQMQEGQCIEPAAQRSPSPKGKGDRCKGLMAPCAILHPCTDGIAAHRCTSLHGEDDYDLDERDAIQNQDRYGKPQTIPQERMMRGLIEGARRYAKNDVTSAA